MVDFKQDVSFAQVIAGVLRRFCVVVLGALLLGAGATGPAIAGAMEEAIWSALAPQEKDKVLQTLINELRDVEKKIGEEAEARKKADKTLSQLLDDVYKSKKKTTWRAYSSKYAGIALESIALDKGVKFARLVSEGDGFGLQSELVHVGSDVFSQMISDGLKTRGLTDTQMVWDTFVKHASSFEKIGVAYMSGNTGEALKIAKKEAVSKLEKLTESSLVWAIDWIFKDLGLSPGGPYLKLVKSSAEFFEWSNVFVANYYEKDCLDLYKAEYTKQTNNKYLAYSAYNDCVSLAGKANATFHYAALLKKAGANLNEVELEMLEAYRKKGTSPRTWIEALYRKRIADAEAVFAKDLAKPQKDMRAAGDAFSAALGARLSALARDAMSEEEIEALNEPARKALAAARKDVDAALRGSAGVLAACGEFDAALARADAAETKMAAMSFSASAIRNLSSAIPSCDVPPGRLDAELVKAQNLKADADRALADARSAMDATCAAKESVAAATTKDEARQHVVAARDAAAEAAAAIAAGRDAHQGFVGILETVSKEQHAPKNSYTLTMARLNLQKLDTYLAETRAGAAEFETHVAGFLGAKADMQTALQRAESLTGHIVQRAERARNTLQPHRYGPLGARVKAVLDPLEDAVDAAKACHQRIDDVWTTGVFPWKDRQPGDAPDLAELELLVAQAKERCPVEGDTADADRLARQQIEQLRAEVKAITVSLGDIKPVYELCFAQAAVAYSEQWSNQPPVTEEGVAPPVLPQHDPATDPGATVAMPEVIGFEGEKAAGRVLGVGLGVRIETRGAADAPDKKPGFVHAASAATGEMLPKNTVVTLTTYDARPVVEVPALANVTTAEAERRLQAAGLRFAGIALGEPAPTAAETGTVYTSNPAHPAKLEMFSPVTPVIYGPPKVMLLPMPNVANRSVQEAKGILAYYGQHFVAGPLALGPDRPDDVNTGDVHFTDPPAGQPVPAGTVVTFYVYPPQEEPTEALVEIPREIIGMPAGPAATLLRGWDNVLVVPAPIEADAARDGETPGYVQYSVPAAGTKAPKGSIVQLYVFSAAKQEVVQEVEPEVQPEAEPEISMQACPDPNPRTDSHRYKIDSNNNPDDQTYLECAYYKEGPLKLQIPYTDGKYDGVWLDHLKYPKCGGRVLSTKMIYNNGQREKWWSYSCDNRTGTYYKMRETTYSNNKVAREVQWNSNGTLSRDTTYDPPGRIKRTLSYNNNGKFLYCRDRNATGTAIPCD